MKAQIRRWSNEDNKNYFIDVEINNSSSGQIEVSKDGIILTAGHDSIEAAISAAEKIILRHYIK